MHLDKMFQIKSLGKVPGQFVPCKEYQKHYCTLFIVTVLSKNMIRRSYSLVHIGFSLQQNRMAIHDFCVLNHWGLVMHICICNLTIIASDNGMLPVRRQAIIRTNAGILLSGTLGTNVSEILIQICTFSFKNMHLKMSSGKMATILSWPQCVNSADWFKCSVMYFMQPMLSFCCEWKIINFPIYIVHCVQCY